MSSDEYSYNKEIQNFKRKDLKKNTEISPKNKSKSNSFINIRDDLKKALIPKFNDLILNVIKP